MKGVILAAGYGKRLRPLTIWRAKPAVPFLNRPLIEYSLDLFRRSGIQEIAVNLHHAPDSVVRAVGGYLDPLQEPTPTILFSEEPEILGTAGAFGPLRSFLQGGDFVVSNGKIYFEEENLDRLRAHHLESENLVTMVLVERDENEPFTPVRLSPEGAITSFTAQSETATDRAYTYTGVQIVSPQVLDLIPDRPFDTVRELYPEIWRQGGRIGGWVSRAYWCECSLPSRYLNKSFEVLHRLGKSHLSTAPLHPELDRVIFGPRVEISPQCRLDRTIIWGDTRVGAGSQLHDVIISGGLDLPESTRLSQVVVTPRLENIPGSLAAEGQIRDCCVIWPLK